MSTPQRSRSYQDDYQRAAQQPQKARSKNPAATAILEGVTFRSPSRTESCTYDMRQRWAARLLPPPRLVVPGVPRIVQTPP